MNVKYNDDDIICLIYTIKQINLFNYYLLIINY